MKRGYVDWVRDILPEETLKARRDALAKLAREQGLKAAVVYGDVYAADELSWFCNYAPYWCNAALIVTQDSGATLVTGHNYRVNPWISSLTGLPEAQILPAGPRVPAKLAERLADAFPEGGTVGTVGKYILSDVKLELSAKNFATVPVDSAVEKEMCQYDKSFHETEKRAYAILREAVRTGISSCRGKAATKKEVCAEIEYAARKNSAMDVFLYTSGDGCSFHLPDSGSSAAGTWNLYVLLQYLGVWVGCGLAVGADADGAWAKLDRLARGLRPGAVPKLEADGCRVIVRPNGAADMVSSLGASGGRLQEGGIVSVAVLENATGTYFERMYEVCADGAKAL